MDVPVLTPISQDSPSVSWGTMVTRISSPSLAVCVLKSDPTGHTQIGVAGARKASWVW